RQDRDDPVLGELVQHQDGQRQQIGRPAVLRDAHAAAPCAASQAATASSQRSQRKLGGFTSGNLRQQRAHLGSCSASTRTARSPPSQSVARLVRNTSAGSRPLKASTSAPATVTAASSAPPITFSRRATS